MQDCIQCEAVASDPNTVKPYSERVNARDSLSIPSYSDNGILGGEARSSRASARKRRESFVAPAILKICRRIQVTRKLIGYDDASDFAKDAGLMPDRYIQIERGRIEPKLLEVIAIAEIAEKSLDWLLVGRARPADKD